MSTETKLSPEEELLEIHQRYVVANRTGDTAWCRANMAGGEDGVVLFNTNGSNYVGVDHWCNLWEYYQKHITGDSRTKGEPPLFESIDPKVTVVGDAAWITYRLRMVGKLDGEKMPESARGTEIYRNIDDQWQMVHGHWSIGEAGGPAGGL
jgi:ketosteroid isomerase-like protein